MRTGLAAVAVAFLAAHLAGLPPALEDLDSINFALGVRDFDVANHQPHPPGYPVFIALGKVSTAALLAGGTGGAEARGLAMWGAISGAACVFLVFVFFERLGGDRWRAASAAVITAAAPLFWFTASRPLSDMTGLAASFVALALIAAALAPRSGGRSAALLIAGAFVAGLAAGVRSQTLILTLPLLAWAVLRAAPARRDQLAAVGALAAGILLWAIPLIVATGGPTAYVAALRNQGAEDFTGVVMLWTQPSVRVAAFALLYTFVLPWHSPVLAGVVSVLAAVGLTMLLWRAPRLVLLLAIAFVPYAIFHILFQETLTVRYALPLLPAIAYLAVVPLTSLGRVAGSLGVGAVAAAALWLVVPPTAAFGREASPIARLMADMRAESSPEPVIAMHRRVWTETRRARRWWRGLPGRLLEAPRDFEWLEMTRAWREGATGPMWFIADPRRTDLALIDSRARQTRPYRWPFDGRVYVGGARPDEIDWHIYSSPGWFLEQGWALTPEIAGVSQREGWELHVRPALGWIRRRPDPAVLMFGGRHLGGAGSPQATVEVNIDGRLLVSTATQPGFFLRFVDVPAGTLAGEGPYARLTASARAPSGADAPRVAVEQFDLQSTDTVMFGFDEGWHEPEYNPRSARSWRWMSERAVLRIRPTRRDVTLTLLGESPLRYFDAPPSVRVTVAGQEVGRFGPSDDFTQEVRLPSTLLDAAGGQVILESDRWFAPAEREASADRRHLALRIYQVRVVPSP